MSLETLYAEIERGRYSWNELYDFLLRIKYDINGLRAGLNDQSVESLRQRVTFVFEGLLSLKPIEEGSIQSIVIAAKEQEIRQSLNSFIQHVQSSMGSLQPSWREGLSVKDTNSNFGIQIVQSDGSVVTSVDLLGNFQLIDSAINQLTSQFAGLLPLLRTDGGADLTHRASAVGDLVRQISGLLDEAKKLTSNAESSASAVAEKEKSTQSILTQAEAALAKLVALQQQATTDTGNVSALVEKIKAVGAGADVLEQSIAGYQAKFDAFQKQLDGRNSDFSKFQSDTKTAKEASEKRDIEIDRLARLADAMISGATTAGLAKSLEDTRKRYEERMNGARIGFYVAVVLLIASALPLAAHLLPGLFGQWIPKLDPNAEGNPYSVLGKIVLLLPATWLTAFFSKTYANFFHLEREYAHKAALAMSVDGFKRQAEKYQEEITAEVFLEIRNNPARGKAVEPASHPLYDVLSKAVAKVLQKGEDKK